MNFYLLKQILIGSILLLATRPLIAQGQHHGDREPRILRIIEQLNLSPGQLEKLKSLSQDLKAKIKTARNNEKMARETFMSALNQPETEAETLQALHEKVIQARAETMRSRFALMNQLRAELTQEQRVEFSNLRSQFAEQRGRRKHRGRRDMHGGPANPAFRGKGAVTSPTTPSSQDSSPAERLEGQP